MHVKTWEEFDFNKTRIKKIDCLKCKADLNYLNQNFTPSLLCLAYNFIYDAIGHIEACWMWSRGLTVCHNYSCFVLALCQNVIKVNSKAPRFAITFFPNIYLIVDVTICRFNFSWTDEPLFQSSRCPHKNDYYCRYFILKVESGQLWVRETRYYPL